LLVHFIQSKAACAVVKSDVELSVNILVIQGSTVTAHIYPFTLVTGKLISVSVIPVTCQSVLVVIVGTLVEVHLLVYAV
jgi:hypothetical protein